MTPSALPRCLALVLVLFLAAAALPALARAAEQRAKPGWKFSLTQGEAVPSTVQVRNVCTSAHDFRVSTPGTPWAALERDAERLRVAGRSAIELGVRFESARLAPGVYEGEVLVECLDCERDPKFALEGRDYLVIPTCDGTPQRFPVEMTVLASGSSAGATPPQRPASEVRNIAATMRDRLADALARLAGRRGLAIAPESLTVLSLPAGGLVAGARVVGLETLTGAQLAAGAEVLFLHLDLAAANGETVPSGEYTLSVRIAASTGAARAVLLDAQGAAVHDLPLASEALPGGGAVYVAELAPGLALPAWCSAPAGAPRLWRGWPLVCVNTGTDGSD